MDCFLETPPFVSETPPFGIIDNGQPKYIDYLPKIINGINNTAGRTTKLAPNNITPLTVGDARMNIYDYNTKQENKFLGKKTGRKPPPKYRVDGYVLIKKEKKNHLEKNIKTV